ncbi:hypothetical protein DFH09DRAFT_1090674 [Mycena vulgaris]|nr:hypothetical protein DFH09DRAFT_1090674 [Mycena vulgaris]
MKANPESGVKGVGSNGPLGDTREIRTSREAAYAPLPGNNFRYPTRGWYFEYFKFSLPTRVDKSESVEDAKNWESYRFVRKLTLPSSTKLNGSDPDLEHSIGSIEAGREMLKYSGSGSRGQFRTQGTPGSSGDEDEALEIPNRSNAPKSKARLKGKSKRRPKPPNRSGAKNGEKKNRNVSLPQRPVFNDSRSGQTKSRRWRF